MKTLGEFVVYHTSKENYTYISGLVHVVQVVNILLRWL